MRPRTALLRNLILRVHGMAWLVDAGTAGLRALEEDTYIQRTKLLNEAVARSWSAVRDAAAPPAPDLQFADEADHKLHRTLLGQLRHDGNLFPGLAAADMYTVYRLLSGHAHFSAHSAYTFLHRDALVARILDPFELFAGLMQHTGLRGGGLASLAQLLAPVKKPDLPVLVPAGSSEAPAPLPQVERAALGVAVTPLFTVAKPWFTPWTGMVADGKNPSAAPRLRRRAEREYGRPAQRPRAGPCRDQSAAGRPRPT